MCGITAWVDWKRSLHYSRSTVAKMAQTMCKRGPDAMNVWCHKQAAFGHTRLIVVDPLGGNQPMQRTQDDRRYTLVYNGELYNTEDIRNELRARKHSFSSHSDTEVLLKAYMEWGASCLERLNGIFAFAIWDEQKEQLFMARDRLGVKPLFYREAGGMLLFGSELKAILAHPEVKAEVDREGLANVFGLGPSRTPGHGLFKGIQELRPAHALRYDRNGVSVYRYWQVQSHEHEHDDEQTAYHVQTLLKDAVQRQLVADVPVGTFLSGGVDSSAISAFAAQAFRDHGQSPLSTYAIDYEENDKYFKASDFQPNADGPWIEKVSAHLGTEHLSFVINNEQLGGLLEEAVIVRDQPGMADVDYSLLWFCRQIRKETTVALSGECADEIFGGYPWFHRRELMERDNFPWMKSVEERENLLRQEWRNKLKLAEYVHEQYKRTLAEVPALEGEDALQARRRELFYLNMVWFMTTLLDRKDRMSMGASLEVRVPFADHRLVEYVWNIPWQTKMYGNREKGILRKALEGWLPNDVLYRKKSPYPKTHHPAYTQAVQKWLLKIVDNAAAPLWELVDRDYVRQIAETEGQAFKSPWFGQLMTGPQLMAHLAQINTWLETYNIDIAE
jgi:asparagine synthase (glutamine-hydrolysing)